MAYDIGYLSWWSGDTEVTVDTTNSTAEIDCGNDYANFGYADMGWTEVGPNYCYFRLAYGTDPTFSSIEGASVTWSKALSFMEFGDLTTADITITVTGTDTRYYYEIQATTDTGGTWEDPWAPPAGTGQFDIGSVGGVNPTVVFTTSFIPVTATAAPTVLYANGCDSVNVETFTMGIANATTDIATKSDTYIERAYLFANAAANGTYTAWITCTNATGSSTSSLTFEVGAAVCTASFTVSTTTVATDQRNVVASIYDSSTVADTTNDSISQWLWTVTKPSAATETFVAQPNLTLNYGTNVTDCGVYSVQLSATSVLGAESSAIITSAFTVNYLAPTATFTATPCIGDITHTVTFYNNSTGDWGACEWNFGDTTTSTSTATSLTHSYITATGVSITLTVTGSNTSDTSSATRTDYIVTRAGTYGQTLEGFLEEVKWHLLEDPNVTVCAAFTEFGGIDNVLNMYYRRLWDFLKETEILKSETSLTTESSGVYTLPASMIKLCRVEYGGYAINPMDRKQADLFDSDWESTTEGDVAGYIIEPEDSLSLKLVPMVTGATTTGLKILYVAATTALTTSPDNCAGWPVLPLPYALTWAVKWGLISDLLSQEGEMNDPVRAKVAEQLYQVGIVAAKLLVTKRAS